MEVETTGVPIAIASNALILVPGALDDPERLRSGRPFEQGARVVRRRVTVVGSSDDQDGPVERRDSIGRCQQIGVETEAGFDLPEEERRKEAALNRPGLSPVARDLVREYFEQLRPEEEPE